MLLDVADLKVHFALRGSFAARLLGRETGVVKAVDGVSFQLRRGEVLGLVGESGSGKTTLGRAILGLVRPTGGRVCLDGIEISALREAQLRPLRRRMQMIFQDPHASLNPAMNLAEAIGHPLRIQKITRDKDEIRSQVAAALDRVGLTPVERFLDKYPADLSGGQKQRAVIARAIILHPELVVADEPVSMLDMSVRAKVLELMVDLKRDLGLTYLYVTHDLATARFFCDRVAIMYLGRIVEIGPAEQIYAEPRHPYTVSLLRAIPEPDPRRAVPRDLPRGEVPDAVHPPLGCAFHPRCPRAFAPCGWESRDLRALFEQRWTTLSEEEFAAERELVDAVGTLDIPATTAHLPALRGRDPAALADLLASIRAHQPDEPFWRGVEDVHSADGGVTVTFRDGVEPQLRPIADGDVEVACHLYDNAFQS